MEKKIQLWIQNVWYVLSRLHLLLWSLFFLVKPHWNIVVSDISPLFVPSSFPTSVLNVECKTKRFWIALVYENANALKVESRKWRHLTAELFHVFTRKKIIASVPSPNTKRLYSADSLKWKLALLFEWLYDLTVTRIRMSRM